MKRMSFALTTEQVRHKTKTVTRRLRWDDLKEGTMLQPVVKGMGIPKGGHAETIGGPIRVRYVRKEPLGLLLHPNGCGGHYPGYTAQQALAEIIDEGFGPNHPTIKTPADFVRMFCEHNKCTPETMVNRIAFEYVEERERLYDAIAMQKTLSGYEPACECTVYLQQRDADAPPELRHSDGVKLRAVVGECVESKNRKEMKMEIGTKFEVVKGGKIAPFGDGQGEQFKTGEIWDLVKSGFGSPCLRKLNNRGGSIRLLNGRHFACCGVDIGKLRILDANDPKFVAHDELIKRVTSK